MCPTLLGRLHTRLAMVALPALAAAIAFWLGAGAHWLALAGMWLVLGAAVDAGLYRPLVRWQPGVLTVGMGLAEWILVAGVAHAVHLGIGVVALSVAYWSGWLVGHAVRLAVLPVVFVTRQEEGGEVGRPRWWIPAGQHVRPPAPDRGTPLPPRLSGLWTHPTSDGPALPPPSHVGPIPAEFLAALDALRERRQEG